MTFTLPNADLGIYFCPICQNGTKQEHLNGGLYYCTKCFIVRYLFYERESGT